jgi:hypothetical protein
MVISQLELSINYLYDRYRLIHQIKKEPDPTPAQKLKTIQVNIFKFNYFFIHFSIFRNLFYIELIL